jgi:hypothetical protein
MWWMFFSWRNYGYRCFRQSCYGKYHKRVSMVNKIIKSSTGKYSISYYFVSWSYYFVSWSGPRLVSKYGRKTEEDY